ncbi:MAG: ribonuclease H [Terracidiphilus sp.]
MNNQFFIFTDGSSIGNPGPAGWAAIVLHGTKRQEIAGSVPWSTVSEMELRAAVEALRLTPTGARIELRSDSELLIEGMRFLVFRWQRDGWRNSRGFDLQHQELWRELLYLNELRTIRWWWIRGHSGHPIQSRADALAYQAARAQFSSLPMAA